MNSTQITGYKIRKMMVLNHQNELLNADGLEKKISVLGNPNDLDPLATELSHLLFSHLKKKTTQKTFAELYDITTEYLKTREGLILPLSGFMANETLFTLRRFLYSRGKKAFFKSHSKTRCPLGTYLNKLFPFWVVQVNKKSLTVYNPQDKNLTQPIEKPLSDILVIYTNIFDNSFPANIEISREDCILKIEEIISQHTVNPDYRE